MKIAITGASGQLGQDLVRSLRALHDVVPLTRAELDVTDEDAVRTVLGLERPDAVVHAAAYTNVDGAEREPEAAYRVNAVGTWHVASTARDIGAKLVYVSTDYVFDGSKTTPYETEDRVNPINVYGASKLLGEKFASLLCERHFIVRTSWLYGRSGANFVTKIAAKALLDRELTLVDDQFGSPTYTIDLAERIGRLLESDEYGMYHGANAGCCSRYDFGLEIVRILGLEDKVKLFPVRSAAYPSPAARPAYSVLGDEAARSRGLPAMREWGAALDDFIQSDFRAKEERQP